MLHKPPELCERSRLVGEVLLPDPKTISTPLDIESEEHYHTSGLVRPMRVQILLSFLALLSCTDMNLT